MLQFLFVFAVQISAGRALKSEFFSHEYSVLKKQSHRSEFYSIRQSKNNFNPNNFWFGSKFEDTTSLSTLI